MSELHGGKATEAKEEEEKEEEKEKEEDSGIGKEERIHQKVHGKERTNGNIHTIQKVVKAIFR